MLEDETYFEELSSTWSHNRNTSSHEMDPVISRV